MISSPRDKSFVDAEREALRFLENFSYRYLHYANTICRYAFQGQRRTHQLRCPQNRHFCRPGFFPEARLVKEFYEHEAANLTVYNEFGPSKSTVQTTCYKAKYPETIEEVVSIGCWLPYYYHYAIDSKTRPVTASAPGELCERGPQVGAGYIARQEATRAVYVEDLIASETSGLEAG